VVSRLLPYKRVDLAIRACALAGMTLLIIGTGPAEETLLRLAHGTRTHFLGQVDDATRAKIMADATVVILPAEEDFGLVPIEAAAAGRPCIAYRAGGALETILEHRTGEFFADLEPESLAATLRQYADVEYDALDLRAHAEQFAPARFTERLRAIVTQVRSEAELKKALTVSASTLTEIS
jgi:glycosyltransferase involved in cell wall biosynthesis